MFNAVFSVTLAEGANAEQYVADAKAAAEAVSPVFLADMVLEPPMPGGNFFCEVGFADQAAYEAAKDGPFLSKDDFRERTKVSKTMVDLMDSLNLLGNLPESNQLSLFDF